MIGKRNLSSIQQSEKNDRGSCRLPVTNKTTAFEYGVCVCRNFKMCIKHFKFNLVSIYCENYRSLTVFCMSCVALIHCNSKPFSNGLIAIKQQHHTYSTTAAAATATYTTAKKFARKMSPRWTNQTIFKIKLSSSLSTVSHKHIRNKRWQKSRHTHTVAIGAVEMKCTVLISAQLMFDVEYVPISVCFFLFIISHSRNLISARHSD